MKSTVFDRLDEIEQVEIQSSGLVAEAAVLMDKFATGSNESAILINRYGHSAAPNIAAAVASLLARKAQEPSREMAHFVLTFVASFQCWNHPETVMNSLTAVQHCLHYVDPSAGEALKCLSPFLRACVDYKARLWVIIRGHALALLPIVWERDLVNKIFTDDEVVWLREKVRELQTTAGEELREELLPLADLI